MVFRNEHMSGIVHYTLYYIQLKTFVEVYSVQCRPRHVLVERPRRRRSTNTWQVPSRPKSRVYNCFIKLSGILHEIDFKHKETSMVLSVASKNRRKIRCVYYDVMGKCTPNSPVEATSWSVNLRVLFWHHRDPEYTVVKHLRCTYSEIDEENTSWSITNKQN